MHASGRAIAAAAVLTVTAALTACGSSGGAGGTSAPGTSAAAPSGSGTPANAATKAAISKAYATFFGTTATLAQSVAALQNGDKFVAAIKKESKNSYAAKSSAKVTSATLMSPHVAAVKFSISSGGQTLLKHSPGFAVEQNGTWKVAAKTFCGLLQLQGDAPNACSDPQVTALPH